MDGNISADLQVEIDRARIAGKILDEAEPKAIKA
jgi:hypothetical protein